MDKLQRMQELVATLNEWARLYYEEDAPVVSDAEYDKLYDELRALESEEGFSLPTSPTHRVGGAPQKKFEQSKHLQRLYSLDKCQSKEEFYAWCERIKKQLGKLPLLTCEYKFDGLTLNLLYEGGKLVKATTRGDGWSSILPDESGSLPLPRWLLSAEPSSPHSRYSTPPVSAVPTGCG